MTVPGIPARARPTAREAAPDLTLRTPRAPAPAGGARWALVACLLPTLLAAAVFVPRLGGDFVADSYQFLALLEVLAQRGTTVGEVLASDAYQTSLLPFYRPLALLSLALDYRLFGVDPFAFRLVNLLVHAVGALLLGRVASVVTGRRGLGLATACLFAVSPLSAEAVYWASTRGTLLAAAMGTAALLAVVAAERRRAAGRRTWPLLPPAFVCLAAALLAQETAVAFVPLLGVAALAVQRERGVAGVAAALRRTAWAWLLLGAYLVWRRVVLGKWLGGYGAGELDVLAPGFWEQRLAHLLTAVSPVHLGSFPMAVKVTFGGLLALALVAAAIHAVRTPSARPLAAIMAGWVACFCLPSVFLAVDPENLTNGRLLYVQSAGVLALVALGTLAIAGRSRCVGVAAGVAVACSAAVLWGNLRPWRAAGALAGSLRQQIAAAEPRTELLLADLPFARDGAFVTTDAIALPPFVPVGTAPRTAFTDAETDLVLHWLAQRRDDGFTVWRFDPAQSRFTPHSLSLPRPYGLATGGRVVAARSRWLDEATLGVDALVTGVEAPIPVRVLDGEGVVRVQGELRAAGPSRIGDVRRARLPLPADLTGALRVELADGAAWQPLDTATRAQRGRSK